jgi:hypothetical protein
LAGGKFQDRLDDFNVLWIGGEGKKGEQRLGARVAVSVDARP